MSNHPVFDRDPFRPESARDFSQRSRRLSKWLGLPYQRSQELLARIYGYSNFHELRVRLQRPGTPGPFDAPDSIVEPTVESRAPDRESRIAHLIAECKGIKECELTARDRAVASMGLFRQAALHRSIYNALTRRTKGDETSDSINSNAPESLKARRVVTAPPPSYPGLPAPVLDVACAEDEDVEWLWTATAAGRFVSGYRLVPRARVRARRRLADELDEIAHVAGHPTRLVKARHRAPR